MASPDVKRTARNASGAGAESQNAKCRFRPAQGCNHSALRRRAGRVRGQLASPGEGGSCGRAAADGDDVEPAGRQDGRRRRVGARVARVGREQPGGGVWASDGSARVGAEAAESARLAIRAGPRFIPLVAAPAAWVRQPASAVAWAADAADGAGALRVLSTGQLPCPGPDYTSRARAGGGQLSSVSRRTSRASRTGAHRLSHTAAVLTVQTADETRSRRGVCATIPAA